MILMQKYITMQFQKSFCGAFDLVNLIREPTCYKNPEKPSCIDRILTDNLIVFKIQMLLRQVFQIFLG